MNFYDITKNYLKNLLDKPTYEKWIEPLSYIGTMKNILFLGSPDEKKTTWIRKNLLEKVNTHTKKEFDFILKLVPLYEEENNGDQSNEKRAPEEPVEDFSRSIFINSNLNKKYTFNSFVQLDSNRMAYSFAYSVAEFPGKSYNPLYIYSDVGLGKTHLLYAIGNRIVENDNAMRVIYLTTSDFMNEYVEYTRLNKRSEFIKKYTSVDVLLIDDIQYITKWGGTSEQFYYIFNKLIQMEKQIVICSDKHPDNIPDLEKRIKSRFEWGGIVDILPYDLEGRLAILKKKLHERKNLFKNDFEIPDEVLYFLASSIKENIRQLEGALNRLIGYANLKYSDTSGNRITLAFAKEALKPYISLRKKTVNIEGIQEFVAKKFNINKDELKTKNNSPKIARPRQIAMYICKKVTKNSLTEIGNKFGGKHHTTVLHSIKKVEQEMNDDHEFSREVNSFIKFFEE
jgi:chromosomal replication initiator protein